MDMPIRFDIFDRRTGATVGTAKTRNGARRSVDKRDNAFGGYRFGFREVCATGATRIGI